MIKRHYLLSIAFSTFTSIISYAQTQQKKAAVGEESRFAQQLRGNGFGFAENKGQVADMNKNLRPDVFYVGEGGGATVFMQNNKVSYVYLEPSKMEEMDDKHPQNNKPSITEQERGYRIDMEFLGGSLQPAISTADQVEGYFNYYLGHCPKGVTNVKKYNELTYHEVYKNIDVCFGGKRDMGLKYDIVVKPGGNAKDIQLQYSGQDALELRENRLFFKTGLGEIEEFMPKVYQKIGDQTIDITCKYNLNHSENGTDIISFSIPSYDKNYNLIIDPWITYFGGTNGERSGSVTTDKLGNSIFSGSTKSVDFPVKAGAFMSINQGKNASNYDAFMAKMDPSGGLVFCTYLGGSGPDDGFGIKTDSKNDIYMTGTTVAFFSVDFPAQTWGSAYAQTGNSGIYYAFLVKLSNSGTLIWSTLYGGATGGTYGMDVSIDSGDNIVLLGQSTSTDLPVSAGATQSTLKGGTDVFVAKFDNTGVRQWATYYGGTKSETGYGLDTDPSNNIYFTGFTQSFDYPVISAAQTSNGDLIQSYLTKFDPSGNPLWSTYYSGTAGGNYGVGWAVAADGFGNVFLGINTAATAGIATAGAFQSTLNEQDGTALVKFSSAGSVIWATYIDGSISGSASLGSPHAAASELTGIAIDQFNNIVVAGDTYDSDFPVKGSCAFQTTYGGSEDNFITTFDQSGKQICATIIGTGAVANNYWDNSETSGGQFSDGGPGGGSVAVSGGYAFLIGMSNCGLYPVTAGAFQTTCSNLAGYADNYDDVFTKLCLYTCGLPNTVASFSTTTPSVCTATGVDFTLTNTSCDTNKTTYLWSFTGGTPSTSASKNPTGIKWSSAGTKTVSVKVMSPCDTATFTQTNYITVNVCSTLSATAVKTDVACHGAATGTATVTAVSGSANYTYSWSTAASTVTNSTSNTVSGLTANTYTVTITDGSSVTATTVVTITEPSAITIPAIIPANSTCGNANGSAIASASGGSGALSYTWSNGASGVTASGLVAAVYTVTVKDANGCIQTNTVSIGNTNGPSITSINQSAVLCHGGNTGSAVVSASGTGALTYNWSNTQTGTTAINLAATSYTVTVTDAAGCSSTSGISITEPSAITSPVVITTNSTCGNSNGSAVASASGGTGSLSYSWSNSVSGLTTSGLTAGTTYSLTVTDANNCTQTKTFSVSNTPGPLVSTSIVSAISCSSGTGSVKATATGGTSNYTYNWSAGGSSVTTALQSTITNQLSGIYTVTLTDANGCTASSSVTLTEPAAISIPAITSVNTTCGNANGSAVASASGGSGALTYTWSNTANGQTASALSATNYTVTVKDANGCIQTNTVSIGNTNGPSITSINQSAVLCHGGNTGSAVVSASGTGALTYSWSNTQTGTTATNLSSTLYTVTVNDAAGCSSTGSISIPEPPAITSPVIVTTNSTCGNANGTAVASASGGTGSFSYSWSNSVSDITTTGLTAAATYTLTVTDANACTVTKTFSITNTAGPTASAFVSSPILCNGSTGSATAGATGGSSNYTFNWSNGQTAITSSSVNTIISLAANSYTVTITDASGCTSSTVVSLTQPSAVAIASVTSANANCGQSDGSAIASASGGTGILAYTWSNSASGQTNTGLAANSYTLTVQDMNGCSTAQSVTINNNNAPVINSITVVDELCHGSSTGSAVVNASGTGSLTYNWSNSQTSVTATNLSAAIYTVTVTDVNGCKQQTTVTISQPLAMVAVASQVSPATCGNNNGSASVTVAGGTGPDYSYNWSNGQSSVTSSLNDLAGSLSANAYTVTITDANGCTKTQSALVNNSPAPTINSVTATNVTCSGNADGSAAVSATGTTALTYSWSGSGGSGATATGLIPGTYTITVSDANGCQQISTAIITQPNAVVITGISTSSAKCNVNNGSAVATATGGTGALNYSWSNSQNGATVSNLSATTYTLTVTDANGCAVTNTATINSTNGPSAATAIATTINCNGQPGSVMAIASNGVAPYTYSWSNGTSSVTTSLSQSVSVTAATYTVTITDKNGCTATSSVLLSQPAALNISSTTVPVCGNDYGTISANVTGGVTAYTYSWSTGATAVTNASTQQMDSLKPGNYSVTITDANGCSASLASAVNSLANPVAAAVASQQTITEGNSTVLIASGGATYSWSPASTLNCSNCAAPTASPASTTTYTLYVKSAEGCVDSTQITITVKKACLDGNEVFIANVFSPNGDGANDVLNIEGNAITDIYWSIYDRWGNLVFETTDQAQGWDGTKKGSALESGTYVYYLKALCLKTNEEVRLKGNVSLVK